MSGGGIGGSDGGGGDGDGGGGRNRGPQSVQSVLGSQPEYSAPAPPSSQPSSQPSSSGQVQVSLHTIRSPSTPGGMGGVGGVEGGMMRGPQSPLPIAHAVHSAPEPPSSQSLSET